MEKGSVRVKKIIGIIVFCLILINNFAFAETTFTDIDNHWAEDVIKKWQSSGYISGYPDGSFKPDNPVTRAELSKILTAAFELKDSDQLTFEDVSEEEWYYPYLEKSSKYIPVYPLPTHYDSNSPYIDNWNRNNVFLPNEKAIRGHVAESLVELKAKKENIDIGNVSYHEIAPKIYETFKDAELDTTVHGVPFNVERMNKYIWLAYDMGIMVGYDGCFNQYCYMTRAELITAINKIIQ